MSSRKELDSLVTDAIASIKPYVPGKPVEELERELGISNAIKLASNENLHGPSPKAVEAMRRVLTEVNFYPEGAAPNLRARLAEHLQVPGEELVIGNGSNELIELIVRTFTTTVHHAVISDHAFLVYRLVLTAAGVAFDSTPMRDMTHDLEAMKSAIRENTRLVFIANPNNPTGTYNTRDELESFLNDLPEEVIVVLDEAYFEFVGRDDYTGGIKLRDRHSNLIVLRTFSKCYGLAGVRVGYGVMRPGLATYLNTVRQPFNVNRLGQVAAEAALEDTEYLSSTLAVNAAERSRLEKAFAKRGVAYWPSVTNFILFDLERSGAEVTQQLLQKGVIVRPMAGYGLPTCIRVTVGLPDQNDRFLTAFDEVL
jgi:histidinol-phosphate aminotransferase